MTWPETHELKLSKNEVECLVLGLKSLILNEELELFSKGIQIALLRAILVKLNDCTRIEEAAHRSL